MKNNKRERDLAVLSAVVLSYIESSEPVGSATLSRNRLSRFGLSPATIRNILGDLDEEGFLEKPHPSAGRLPTEKGYRLFVNELMTSAPLPHVMREKIDSALQDNETGSDTAATAVKLLTSLSHQAGIFLLPAMSESVIDRFHFVNISGFRVQAILVTAFTQTHNIVIDTDEDWNEASLTELANYLNENYAGLTLRQIRGRLIKSIARQQKKAARLEAKALAIQEKLIEQIPEPEISIEGAANLLDAPEFERNIKRLKNVMRAFSDKKRMLEVIEKCISNEKLSVTIGSDLQSVDFDGCSLITSSFTGRDGLPGAIGIMGPTRMDYPYLVALTDYITKVIGRRITER
jgi:heat-inducible transcriptional repressor